MSTFPVTSVTLIAKIKNLAPGEDSAAWVRFWNSYSDAIRQFAAMKGGEENADDIVMAVLGKLVDVLRSGQYTPEKGKFHSYLATMIVNEVRMSHRREVARASDRKVSLDSSVGGSAPESTDRTIADIAYDSGFDSHTHLKAAFKKAFGMTMHDWRTGRPPQKNTKA